MSLDIQYSRRRIRSITSVFNSVAEFLTTLGANWGTHEISLEPSRRIPGATALFVEGYGGFYVVSMDDVSQDTLDDMGSVEPFYEDDYEMYGYWEMLTPGG